jgi:hypothetical protein
LRLNPCSYQNCRYLFGKQTSEKIRQTIGTGT